MKPQCIDAVNSAAQTMGLSERTPGQLDAIESRVKAKMRELAGTDPQWQAKSTDQRMNEAAVAAMQDIQAEAAHKVANAKLQIVKTFATETRLADTMRAFGEGRTHALVHDMDQTQNYIKGVKQEAVANLMDMMDAVKSGEGASAGRRVMQFLFDADNPGMTKDLAHELFAQADGSSGNKIAQEGAKAYLKVIEDQRQRFNSAGGDVGKLEYGYIPQPHDAARVRGDATPAARDTWVAKTLPLLNRDRYMTEAGARMNDAELTDVLKKAWETIATDGQNKTAPGTFKGSGARSNHGSESRQIHFKDGQAYLDYMGQFGTGSMYDAVIGHVGRMARDIGLVERYGPNPNAQMLLQMDLAERADKGVERTFGLRPQSYWEVLNGTTASPQSARIAQVGTDLRNIQTFAKLGGAVISSITDMGTYIAGTGYNKLGYWQALKNVGKLATSGETREFLTAHGIIAESMLGDLNRWTADNIRQTWSGRVAQATMKLSLMNAWTDTMRRAFSLTMMQGMARLSRTEWGKLSEWDRTMMERKGLTEADWKVITQAQLTNFQGADHLTPESIHATGDARSNEVVAKVLGLIQDESEFAVINPDLATKAMASGGGMQAGTIRGELARSVMQFKSFPIAMISRHWGRMMDMPKVTDGSAPMLANRTMYGGAMLLTTTALGAIALQIKQIVQGKDPIDMEGPHAGKFWARAVAQGGGLSIVGDLLLNDPTGSPGDTAANAIKTLAGPSIGSASYLALKVGVGNVWEAAKGKQTHAAAEAVSWVKSNAPLNLWYAKAAIDHAGLHAIQENLSPGYLAKMQERAKKEWGQDYWWKPGTGLPQRPPNLLQSIGE